MASSTAQVAQIGRRQVELSNLSKILYPADHITKAHVLEYYLKTAPTVLAQLKARLQFGLEGRNRTFAPTSAELSVYLRTPIPPSAAGSEKRARNI